MSLYLNSAHRSFLYTQAESAYPEECCGLLIGTTTGPNKTILEIWPAENIWNSQTAVSLGDTSNRTKQVRYAIAPEFMLQAQKQCRERHLGILGIYHSHTDNPAIPSECDRHYAWPQYSYIIISVIQTKAADLQNWTLDDTGHFQPEAMLTGDQELGFE